MKPHTKEEIKVVGLSSQMRPLTKMQERWAVKRCFEHEVWATKHTYTCMECGKTWERGESKSKSCRCPHCHSILQVKETLKRSELDYRMYFGVITTHKDYQVFRLFVFHRDYNKGHNAKYSYDEVVQTWINEKGRVFNIARRRKPMSMYYDDWDYYSTMELRANLNIYNEFTSTYYPKVQYLDAVYRNGFKEMDESPVRVVKALLSDSRMETLLKTGHDEIFKYFCSPYCKISKYWDSLKICLRHKYDLTEFMLWKDYIDFLRELKKDLRNPKFVCPKNLREEHNRLQQLVQRKRQKQWEEEARIREIRRREEEEKQLAWETNAEEVFRQLKSKYLNLVFTDGELIAKPLQSVQDYLEEGTAMHHCVFTNRYYSKEDTLVFSTTLNGERVETVEVSLNNGNVLQCYGKYDKFTERHDQVLNLMKANRKLLMDRVNMKVYRGESLAQVQNAS